MGTSYQAAAGVDSSTVRVAKSIVALSGLALVITVPFAMVSALPEMARQFRQVGNGPFVAQMVLALPVLAMLIGAPLGGWIADIIGVRRCLLTALFAYVVAGAICLVAPNLPVLIGARLLLGFCGAAAATMCTALTAEWYQGIERNRILGYAHAVVLAYNILMLVSGGWLVDHFDWRAPSAFYFVGALTLAAAYLGTRGQNGTLTIHRSHASVGLNQVQLWPLYLVSFLLAFGAAVPALQGPFLLSGAGVASSAARGLILVVTIVTGALASASYAALRKRLHHSALILLSGLSMGIGIALTGVRSGDIGLIVVGYIICGIGYGLYIPVISAIVLDATPPDMRNRAVGLMNGAIMLATIANPLVVSLLRRSFELPKSLVVVGIVLAFVGPAFVLLFRPDQRAVA
jgi:MFS family permease